MKNYFHSWGQYLAKQRRDPRYIFTIIGGVFVFTICSIQVSSAGLFDSVERPVFNYFNNLPHGFYDVMFAITQLGGLGGLTIWCSAAWYIVSRRAAYTVAGAGIAAWLLAKVAKIIAHRGRPGQLLDHIHLFDGERLGGFGFPSGHSTFAAACATVLYYQVPRRYRKYLLLIVALVGISRMYLGAHFPLDVVGGWALGALIGALVVTLFGVSNKGVSAVKLKAFMNKRGMDIQSLQFANVDARGSRPIFIQTQDGKQYFGKIFGKQEHAADWLFKVFRFFRYKNLQAEEPHISSRRNVEIEAFAMLWAKQAGVRVARLSNIFQYGSSWVSVQERIDAKPLADYKRLTQTSLEDAWLEVKKLHSARIAHRDLRAANIMIDKQGKAHIIDFGFAEVAASRQRLSMDVAELLMSMTQAVGVERTVEAARKIIKRQDLIRALPYLQKAVFSGATTKQLKQNKGLLTELKDQLKHELHLKNEIDEATIVRVNRRKLINIIILAIFVYIIAPKFGPFKDALAHSHIASLWWLVPVTIASLSTYFLTGLIYMALAPVPLRLRDTTLVQVAASFMSKIVPAGLGSTTLNVKYLTKAGMDSLETSAVVAEQAFIGFIMFMVPLGLFLLLNGTNVFKLIHLHFRPAVFIVIILGIFLGGIVVVSVQKLRRSVADKLTQLIEGVRNNTTPSRDLVLAAVASMSVTGAYILCLYFSLQTIGVDIGITQAITVYAFAVIAKSAIPAPGGLGPVEAAMIASLVGFGIADSAAVSSVIIYRLATFWIPIPFSILSYRYINAKKLV